MGKIVYLGPEKCINNIMGGFVMEDRLIKKIDEELNKGRPTALVTVTYVEGSYPGVAGSVMVVDCQGTKFGTIGGGNLEYQVGEQAKKCIETNHSGEYEYLLENESELDMACGGRAKVFIKAFSTKPRLIIVGGGHVGHAVYDVANYLEFDTLVFDDREEYANKEMYPDALATFSGSIADNLKAYSFTSNTYVVIATRGHRFDLEALNAVIERDYEYIGMIGSSKKVGQTMTTLEERGIAKASLERVYAPIGIGIDNGSPKEIAISIMTEILKVKNQGELEHMKIIKAR